MLRAFWRQVWLTIVVALVMLALYSSVGRQLMPLVDSYQTELEQWLSAQLGQPVQIGALTGSWTGLSPVVTLENLQVGGEQGVQLAFIEANLSLSASLFYRQLVFHSIQVQGSKGVFTQLSEHQWQLAPDWVIELPEPSDTPSVSDKSSPQWPHWLSLQKDIRLNSLELQLQRLQQEQETFQLQQVRWRSLGRQHELKVDLVLGKETLSKVRLQASLMGELWPLQAQNGHLYFELEEQDWSQWLNLDSQAALQLPQLVASAQGWLEVKQGHLEAVYLQADVESLELQREQQSFALDQGKVILAGTHDGDDWHVQLQPQFQQALPFQRLGLSRVKIDAQPVWQIHIPELEVGETQRLLEKYEILPDAVAHFIDGTAPSGMAKNIRFTALQDQRSGEFKFDLQAALQAVNSQAFHGIPALTGAAANLRVQKTAGLVEFQQADLGLHLPDLYSPAWQLEALSGRFRWLIHADHGRLLLEDTQAYVRDATEAGARWPVTASMQILLPRHAQASEPSLSLLLGVAQAPLHMQQQLVPDLVGEGVQQWLNQGLLQGQVDNAQFALQTSLAGERDANDLSLQLALNFSELDLLYLEDWPQAKQLRGALYFDAPSLQVRVDSGHTLGGAVRADSTYARLNWNAQQALLEVGASLVGESQEGLSYFVETPLAELVNQAFDEWQLSGRHQTDFLMRLDLAAEQATPDVWLTSYVANNRLQLTELGLTIDQLSATLSYSPSAGLNSDQVNGRLLGGNFVGEMRSRTRADGSFSVALNGQGQAQWQAIRDWQPLFFLQPISGQFDYQADLQVVDGQVGIQVHSDLLGSDVDLPAPFSKTAASSTPLSVQMDLGAQQLFTIGYGDYLRSRFALENNQLSHGQVVLGGQAAELPKTAGIEVRGELAEIDLEAWWQVWQSLDFSSAADSAAGTETGTEVDESLLQSISLRAQEVNAWGLSLASTQLQGNYHHQHWQFRVESPVLKGDIQWHDDRPLAAQLDYLNLPATEAAVSVEDEHTEQEAVPEQPPVDIWQEVDPAELPEFDLFVAKLQQGEQSYGRWQLQSRQQPQGLQLEITESDLFGLGITGLVTWHKEQGVHHTELHELQIKGSRIERLQQGFGFSPLISSNAVSGQLSAQWPGSPLGYQLQDIEAELSLSLKDGRVAADGASAVKAFGVLNVNSLSRRLKLDFSDLYKSGLAFDRFSTKLNAAEGVVTLTEPINLEGPSGKFITTGTTNLLDQSLDMRVAVVLPVSTNLPLVAILAGLSPPVAASIYVTEKLVGDELSRFTTANYDLKGTWQEPEMTMRSAFNQEGSENRGFFKRLFGR